jgi:hypothetical protein
LEWQALELLIANAFGSFYCGDVASLSKQFFFLKTQILNARSITKGW